MNFICTIIILLAFPIIHTLAQGPYAQPAGHEGTTAIHKDDTSLKSWATGIELFRGWINIADQTATYNDSNKASFGHPALALGKAAGNSFEAVSLGDGGMATLTFDRPIKNGSGADFAVFENGHSDTFLELAFVEVSSDGKRFVRFPAVSLTPADTQVGGFGTLDANNIHNLAGKYRQGFGTPFDLEDIKDSADIDLNNIRFVRITDVVGNIDDAWASYDSQGNKINDPWPTPFNSGGFDLDAIGVIHAGEAYTISGFEDLTLSLGSWWNGSDKSGGFTSNGVFFKNVYDETFSSWHGFAYSNMRDSTTAGYTNQYSAITAGGMHATETAGTNYGTGFVPVDWMSANYDLIPVEVSLDQASTVSGFYVTNSSYAFLSMRDGEMFAKKFGGESGKDPDYFRLLVWGEKEDEAKTDTVVFYLADYRFEDNSKDYIVDNWRFVDLLRLGRVKKLFFSLESSDTGAWGMNTPAYFCIDNLTLVTGEEELATVVLNTHNGEKARAYPNPFVHQLNIECIEGSTISLYDLSGRKILEVKANHPVVMLSTEKLNKGYYILKISNIFGNQSLTVIKQ